MLGRERERGGGERERERERERKEFIHLCSCFLLYDTYEKISPQNLEPKRSSEEDSTPSFSSTLSVVLSRVLFHSTYCLAVLPNTSGCTSSHVSVFLVIHRERGIDIKEEEKRIERGREGG